MTLFNFGKTKDKVEDFVKDKVEDFVKEEKSEDAKNDIPYAIRKFEWATFEVGQGHIEITIDRKTYKTPHTKGHMDSVPSNSYTHHTIRTDVSVGQQSQYAIIGKRIDEILDKTLTKLTRLQGLIQIPGTERYVQLTKVSKILFKKDKLKVRIITGYEDVTNPKAK